MKRVLIVVTSLLLASSTHVRAQYADPDQAPDAGAAIGAAIVGGLLGAAVGAAIGGGHHHENKVNLLGHMGQGGGKKGAPGHGAGGKPGGGGQHRHKPAG